MPPERLTRHLRHSGFGADSDYRFAVGTAWQEAAKAEWQISVKRQNASRAELRRGKRYYRLTKFNGHRISYRIAYKVDPGNAVVDFVAKCLADGTLKLDLTRIKRPSEVDRELRQLVENVNQ